MGKKNSKKETKKKKNISKIICVILMSIILVASGTFGLTLARIQTSKNEVIKLSNQILKSINKKKETSIVFQQGKVTYGKIKLSKIPKDGNASVDKNGNVAITINNGKWCAKKEYYSDEINIIKYSKESCVPSEEATKVITKKSKNSNSFVLLNDDNNSNMKAYFTGKDPNNYLIFAKRCFRIIGITKSESIKIIYEGYADNNNCTNNKDGYSVIERSEFFSNNNWFDEKNTLRLKLENYIKDKNMNKKVSFEDNDIRKLTTELYYVGAVNRNDDDKNMIKNEKSNNNGTALEKKDDYKYESYIGMINVSDFIYASNNEKCNKMSDATSNPDYPCAVDNYLFKEGYPYWTLNSVSEKNNRVWRVSSVGTLLSTQTNKDNVYIRPVLTLNKNIKISGNGTQEKPFVVE